MRNQTSVFLLAAGLALGGPSVEAQDKNLLKVGGILYDTHSKTNGITTTPAIPTLAGSDIKSADAPTLLLVFDRMLKPNLSIELVLGVPPRIDTEATGPLAGLTSALGISNVVLSAKNTAPTLLLNLFLTKPESKWRPYVGAGINYTKLTSAESSLSTSSIDLSDSWGPAAQIGLNYAAGPRWGVFANVSVVRVKSEVDVVANVPGVPVPVRVMTTVDFRPSTYTAGLTYKF